MRRSFFYESPAFLVKSSALLLSLAVGLAAPLCAHHLKKGESASMPITTSSAQGA